MRTKGDDDQAIKDNKGKDGEDELTTSDRYKCGIEENREFGCNSCVMISSNVRVGFGIIIIIAIAISKTFNAMHEIT